MGKKLRGFIPTKHNTKGQRPQGVNTRLGEQGRNIGAQGNRKGSTGRQQDHTRDDTMTGVGSSERRGTTVYTPQMREQTRGSWDHPHEG